MDEIARETTEVALLLFVAVATDAVLDGPRSRVLVQARNRMLAQQAILHRLLA